MKRLLSTSLIAAGLAGGGFGLLNQAVGTAPGQALPGAAMAQDSDAVETPEATETEAEVETGSEAEAETEAETETEVETEAEAETETEAEAETETEAQASGEAEAPADESSSNGIVEMSLGDDAAPVEVIEYASYTCPHCKNFHADVFDRIKEDYVDTGKVKFTYREVYFDKYGMWASLIARCGGEQKFFGITDLIYEGQEDWARAGSDADIADALRKIGRMAGIGGDELEACLTDGDQLRSLVEWYQTNAEADDITSTPSFVIDGEKYSNMPYDEFAGVLDEKLAEAE